MDSARITVYRQQRCVELAHRKLATRERAPLVTIELLEPAGELSTIEALGIQVALGLPHPHNLNMRRCDLRCTLAPIGACSLTRDRARKLCNRLHKLRVEPGRPCEPVTERIAGRARLARRRARPRALARIEPVGVPHFFAGHASGSDAASTTCSARWSLAARLSRRRSSSRSIPSRRLS